MSQQYFVKEIKFPYSVMTTNMEDIKDGDLVDVSYHYKDAWVSIGGKGNFHTSLESVKKVTIGKSEKAVRTWNSSLGLISPKANFEKIVESLLDDKKKILESKYPCGETREDVDFEMFASHVCVLQYHFGHKVDKKNGVWFNIMRTQERIDELIAIEEVKKSKKQEKRQRQKDAKKKEEPQKKEELKRLFVRIRVPQPGGMCHEGNQVVKSWEKAIQPSFYEEIGWFDM